ncbi:hypothetical protein HXX01_03855 [Candidatus Nomurabacteria bacterium]|nr:hypothetical protein [Candidatus Nomurabacteria bacterium]
MNQTITTIHTSTGKLYNLSRAELTWVAGFGKKSSDALICIHHALVYSLHDEEWLTDVIVDHAEYWKQSNELIFKYSQSITGYCKSSIKQCLTEDTKNSAIIELGHMHDGTPCCLLVWRNGDLDYGLGQPYYWITFSCNTDKMVISMKSGFFPSVLSVNRSGIYPGLSFEKLKQLAAFRQGKLPREQPYYFMLIGFPFSKDLEEAEKIVSAALSEFPESSLGIYNQMDSDDTKIHGQFYHRCINSIPHLMICLNDKQIFRLDGPFSSETLSKELDIRFFPAKETVQHQFRLCADCLEKYLALEYDPNSNLSLPLLPSTPFVIISDEHPENGLTTVYHSKQCRDWICYLLTARQYLWEHGAISDQHKVIWAEAQLLIPKWPGFQRLTMNMGLFESDYNEIKEIRDFFYMNLADVTYECIATGFVMWHATIHPLNNL